MQHARGFLESAGVEEWEYELSIEWEHLRENLVVTIKYKSFLIRTNSFNDNKKVEIKMAENEISTPSPCRSII